MLTKLWNRSGIHLDIKSLLQDVAQLLYTARQGGREEHLTHPGMNEGQHASSEGRLQRLGHELRSPCELAAGYRCGCHPAQLKSEWFEEVL